MPLSGPLLAVTAALQLSRPVLGAMGKWDGDFDYSTYLEENQQFRLYWSNLGDDLIDFGIEANSTGYVALGLSPDGGMRNSDIMFGWVDDDGVHLEDRFTDDTLNAPQLDATQNIELIEGEQEDGITRIRFARSKSNACDTEEDTAVTIGTSRVIYAWNNADPVDGEPVYHGTLNRGSQSVNLDGGQAVVVELEDDVESIELLMDEWEVANDDDTEYVCRLLKLPEFDERQHIVAIEPIIQSGNEGTVHHILMYMCPEDDITENATIGGQEVCDDWETNMPSPDCRAGRIEFGWAVGGTASYFPEEAGMPFGGDHPFKYVFMEMHYDNPELRNDIVDSSGLRLWHTPTLREHDLGVITIGTFSSSIMLPPGINTAISMGCSSACTSQTLPEEGLTIIGNLLHEHNVGASLAFRHIRNGQELAPIEVNEAYDFNFQQITMFEEDRRRTILPGDEFILDCAYDTTSREGITYGGESSQQEMCFTFVTAYPMTDTMDWCFEEPTEEARSAWAQEMYDAGYLSMDETTLNEIIDDPDSEVTQFGDIAQGDYQDLDVVWNDLGDSAAMYGKLYSEDAYAGRSQWCTKDHEAWSDYYDHEIADFVEYEAEEVVCEDDDVDENAAAVAVGVGTFLVLSTLL